MAGGLKGLGRVDANARKELTNNDNDAAALAFIGSAPHRAPTSEAAPVKVAAKKAAGPKYKRTNFSLDDSTNAVIDKISLKPRTFKASRSDVVRAGIAALQAMDNKELIKLLGKVTGADAGDDENE